MKMDFEDSMDGLQGMEENHSELPQWVRDNLESQPQEQTALPRWMQENLESQPEGTDTKKDTGRELEALEVLEGVFREFFRKIFGADDNEETTTDTITPTDRYSLNTATDQWHVQEESYSCANACQTFIINEYLGLDVQESDMNELARKEGWYQSDGTAFEDIGNILETYGIEVHRSWGADFNDVKTALDQGDRVIVCVYNAALDDEWGDQLPVASANHAVEVLGVDDSDPNDIKVIVNDPGVSDGCGKVVSLDTFNRARETSGGYMVVAERP